MFYNAPTKQTGTSFLSCVIKKRKGLKLNIQSKNKNSQVSKTSWVSSNLNFISYADSSVNFLGANVDLRKTKNCQKNFSLSCRSLKFWKNFSQLDFLAEFSFSRQKLTRNPNGGHTVESSGPRRILYVTDSFTAKGKVEKKRGCKSWSDKWTSERLPNH